MAGRIYIVVAKIAELCNLNCGYCYMYQHEDQGFRRRPRFMSDAVFERLLERMAEHRDRHASDPGVRRPTRLSIVLHGGEPTLVGAQRLGWMAARARQVLGARLADIAIQTNATLLDAELVETVRREGIIVGVSLDGPPEVHDAVRLDHAGRGSHDATVRGIRLLQEAGVHPGVLCVVNPGEDGLAAYRHFRSLGIDRISHLLPDVSHDNKERLYGRHGPTPVADYLLPVFDHWFDEDDPSIDLRLFHSLIRLILGHPPYNDQFGNPPSRYVVVETDGTIHALDALRVCEDGVAETGLNLFEHGFDDLHLGSPLLHQLVTRGMPLSATCQACPERDVCGGGYLPHRYARANGFDNPSVWCADILRIVAHIRSRLAGAPRRAHNAPALTATPPARHPPAVPA